MWKWIGFGFLTLLLLVSNAFWFWVSFDQAITEKFASQVRYTLSEEVAALLTLSSELTRGHSKEKVSALAQTLFKNRAVFEKDGTVVAGPLVFYFDDTEAVACVRKGTISSAKEQDCSTDPWLAFNESWDPSLRPQTN